MYTSRGSFSSVFESTSSSGFGITIRNSSSSRACIFGLRATCHIASVMAHAVVSVPPTRKVYASFRSSTTEEMRVVTFASGESIRSKRVG